MRSRRRVRPVALALATSALACIGAWIPSSPAGAAAGTRATLALAAQSQWVTPSSAGATAAFDLDLTARDAPAGAMVAVTLYPRLDTRDRFEDVVQHGPRNFPLSKSAPIALSQLPDSRTPGAVALDLQVGTAASTGGSQRLDLSCSGPTAATGTCTGVYPVTVSLLSATDAVLHRFTTFLTYSTTQSATPLRFAWVVPISAPVTVNGGARSPSAALAPLGDAEVARLTQLIASLHAQSAVPVTVAASPETLQELADSGAAGRAAVTTLATMSQDQSVDEVPAASYVPVDLATLAGAGESTEIAAQMAAGATVLRQLHVQTSSSLQWVATAPVGNDLASGLSAPGVAARAAVVPGTSLAPTPEAPSDTWASTFRLSLGTGPGASVDAAETDGYLDAQFGQAGSDPALAATRVLADLAMVHFERPNTPDVRGMVAVPARSWTPDGTFDRTLLDGLDGNPVVSAVTLDRFFSTVTAIGTRTLVSRGSGPALPSSLASRLSQARIRLSEFEQTVVVGKPAVLGQLDHLLLATESDRLTNRVRAHAIDTYDRVFEDQLHQVTFASERTFTLTARTGVIPITVDSKAPYTIVGTISVSGARFTFPVKTSDTMVLNHQTTTWRVNVVARSSGELPLRVTFTSRTGGLVIATEDVKVQSTATSWVGIVLTVLALLVLLAWWGRTWRTKRRRRRVRDQPAPDPEHATAGAS